MMVRKRFLGFLFLFTFFLAGCGGSNLNDNASAGGSSEDFWKIIDASLASLEQDEMQNGASQASIQVQEVIPTLDDNAELQRIRVVGKIQNFSDNNQPKGIQSLGNGLHPIFRGNFDSTTQYSVAIIRSLIGDKLFKLILAALRSDKPLTFLGLPVVSTSGQSGDGTLVGIILVGFVQPGSTPTPPKIPVVVEDNESESHVTEPTPAPTDLASNTNLENNEDPQPPATGGSESPAVDNQEQETQSQSSSFKADVESFAISETDLGKKFKLSLSNVDENQEGATQNITLSLSDSDNLPQADTNDFKILHNGAEINLSELPYSFQLGASGSEFEVRGHQNNGEEEPIEGIQLNFALANCSEGSAIDCSVVIPVEITDVPIEVTESIPVAEETPKDSMTAKEIKASYKQKVAEAKEAFAKDQATYKAGVATAKSKLTEANNAYKKSISDAKSVNATCTTSAKSVYSEAFEKAQTSLAACNLTPQGNLEAATAELASCKETYTSDIASGKSDRDQCLSAATTSADKAACKQIYNETVKAVKETWSNCQKTQKEIQTASKEQITNCKSNYQSTVTLLKETQSNSLKVCSDNYQSAVNSSKTTLQVAKDLYNATVGELKAVFEEKKSAYNQTLVDLKNWLNAQLAALSS